MRRTYTIIAFKRVEINLLGFSTTIFDNEYCNFSVNMKKLQNSLFNYELKNIVNII